MASTRDELRLIEIRGKLDSLCLVSRDDFNLAARYRSLKTLEEILSERVNHVLVTSQA
jgi:hypothetical protein